MSWIGLLLAISSLYAFFYITFKLIAIGLWWCFPTIIILFIIMIIVVGVSLL